jgi:hypothetical protein
MSPEGPFEYALTRIHARHGRRLGEGEWRSLEASRDLASYLEIARAGALAPWVAALDAAADGHAIERSLRSAWRDYVETVAGWHPRDWQPWLAWLSWLPWLALFAQLARPQAPPLWMLADPICGPVAPGSVPERRAALERSCLAPLAAGLGGGQSFAVLWRQHWQRLAPPSDEETRRAHDQLLTALARYAHASAAGNESDAPLRELASRLRGLFRSAGDTAITSACHLGLTALDVQRLRGGLAYRRLSAGVF